MTHHWRRALLRATGFAGLVAVGWLVVGPTDYPTPVRRAIQVAVAAALGFLWVILVHFVRSGERSGSPCCGSAGTRHVRDLGHAHGFDFDLHQCARCGRYWVRAWYEGTHKGGWEQVAQSDASAMATTPEPELPALMEVWARKFE